MTISFETQVMKDTATKLIDSGTAFSETIAPKLEEAGSGWHQWPLVGLGVKGAVDQALGDLGEAVDAARSTCEQVGNQVKEAARLYEEFETQ